MTPASTFMAGVSPLKPHIRIMRRSIPLLALTAALASPALSSEASAQTSPWRPADPARPAWSPRPASTADAHRLEMDRLRATADRNQAVARSNADTARRAAADLAARRAPEPVPPVRTREAPPRPDPLPAPARTASASEIDAWLDRRPD